MLPINEPAAVAAVTAAFDAYEAALVANDVDALQNFFWNSPDAVRFGATEQLYGYDAIADFRRHRVINFRQRRPTKLTVTTFGPAFASVMFEYVANFTGTDRPGRQSQTWVKIGEVWKIVSAHISLAPVSPGSDPRAFVDQALTALGLAPEAAWRPTIDHHFATATRLAAPLLAFALPSETEPAPVFHP